MVERRFGGRDKPLVLSFTRPRRAAGPVKDPPCSTPASPGRPAKTHTVCTKRSGPDLRLSFAAANPRRRTIIELKAPRDKTGCVDRHGPPKVLERAKGVHP